MGFLFGYRNANGAQADWLAVAGIAHPEETGKMKQLVEKSADIICTLPWAVPGENNGKGPFEPYGVDVPDFAIIHVLASVSSTVWEAMNLTIDDENGKRHGVKSLVFGNRMSLNSSPGRPCYYVHHSEIASYISCAHILRFIGTVIHEILRHGTGKPLTETATGNFNFDHKNKPISPVTGQPIKTWYRPGESWNIVFGNLAPTVEECRAFIVANYFADNKDILALFGYDESSTPTADDLIYFAYIRIGIEGLRALDSFKVEDQSWGSDHAQIDRDDAIWIEHNPVAKDLFVRVDRSKIVFHGKPSIGRMLCQIHVWHCTADIDACRPFLEALTVVDGEYEI
ncbi:dipeptidyl-peptidase 3 [Penicillium malachiteum]|nr:dipeptidyl-peptidase 3 [Penicillium malachiteum]